MTWFDLAEADVDLRREAEICIVGGGMAGLATAHRLVAAGVRVCVLESGGFVLDESLEALNAVDDPSGDYAGPRTSRVRRIGGGSTLWGGRLLPLTAHDLGPRAYAAIDPWPLGTADLQAYTGSIEALFGLDHTPFEMQDLARLSERFAIYPQHDGACCRFPKFPTFRNRNLVKRLRRPIAAREGFSVYLNATVQGFALDREAGRLGAVVAGTPRGKTLRVAARYFVFAAGTIETTRLALVLDRASGGHAFGRCAVLGNYFHDHLKVDVGRIRPIDARVTNRLLGYHMARATRRCLHIELSAEAQRRLAIPSAYLDFRLALPERSPHRVLRGLGRRAQERVKAPDLKRVRDAFDPRILGNLLYWYLRHRQLYLPAEVGIGVELRIEQAPIAAHRISLSERHDAYGVPLARLHWAPTEADRRTFATALRHFETVWSQTGLVRSSPVAWSASDGAAGERIFGTARDASHPAGSTRMGLDPNRSVVDPGLRCHDAPNLFLVSASVFPAAGSANPTLTLLQLAHRCADRIVREIRPARP